MLPFKTLGDIMTVQNQNARRVWQTFSSLTPRSRRRARSWGLGSPSEGKTENSWQWPLTKDSMFALATPWMPPYHSPHALRSVMQYYCAVFTCALAALTRQRTLRV